MTDAKITFTLNPRRSPRNARTLKMTKFGVFVIIQVEARLDGQPHLQECVVKGTLSALSPYYEYTYTYQRETNEYGLTYRLQRLCASRPVSHLRYVQLEWMLQYELQFSRPTVSRILQNVPGGSQTHLVGNALLARLPRSVYTRLKATSKYFRETSHSRLGPWFTHITAQDLEQALGELSDDARGALEHLAEYAPWRLALRGCTKPWRECGLPAPVTDAFLQALAAWTAPEHSDNDGTLDIVEPRPSAEELQSAVALEERLRARQKRCCDTVFLREDAVPRMSATDENSGDNDPMIVTSGGGPPPEDPTAVIALRLLVTAEAVVMRTIEGRPVYSLAKHAAIRQTLVKHVRALLSPPLSSATPPWDPEPATTETLGAKLGLCAEQIRAVQVAVRMPLSVLTGGPGCGKTRVIEANVKRFGGAVVAVRTLTGSMAAALRERGILGASTLHRGLYRLGQWRRWQDEGRPAPNPEDEDESDAHPLAELEQRTQVLIVDETSNVSEKLMARVLAAYPNLQRLVLVFDPDQIPPIGPGQPAIDLLAILPSHTVTRLTTNHRVAADARMLVENDRALVQRRFAEIQMADFALDTLETSADDRPSPEHVARFAATGSATVHASDLARPEGLRRALMWTLQHLVCGGRMPTVSDMEHVLLIVLTNDLRRRLNGFVEDLVAPISRPRLYRGKRLTVTDRNYGRIVFSEVTTTPVWSALPAPVVPEVSEDSKDSNKLVRRRKGLVSDEVCNGELFVFHEYCDYNLGTRRWGPVRTQLAHGQSLQPSRQTLRVLRMAGGQQIVLGSTTGGQGSVITGVAPDHLQTEWVITVDKAQGRQEKVVIKVLPPPQPVASMPGRRHRYAQSFRRNHAHVGLSRAEDRFILLGERKHLHELARRPPRPRLTLLSEDLRALVNHYMPVRTPMPSARIQTLLAPGAPSTSLTSTTIDKNGVDDPKAFLDNLFGRMAL